MTLTAGWYDAHYYDRVRRRPSPWHALIIEWFLKARPTGPVLDIGCGDGGLLEELLRRGLYGADELFGIDQSERAFFGLDPRLQLVTVGNIEAPLPYASQSMRIVVAAEVIACIVDPRSLLREIRRIIMPGGSLILSFPNYINLPWLAVRILAEILDKPSWIALQPIDRLLTFFVARRMLCESGFRITRAMGTVYAPPYMYRWEPVAFRDAMNALGAAALAFHPVLVCESAEPLN